MLTLLYFAFVICYCTATQYDLTVDDDWVSTLQSLVAGDVAYLAPGTYTVTSRLGLNLAGTETQPITISTTPGSVTRANIYRPNVNQNLMDIDTGSNYVIRDLELSGGSLGLRMGSGAEVENVLIHNVSIHDTETTGLSCNQHACTNVTVQYTEIYNTGSETSECMYFGHQGGDFWTTECNFFFNYCHDTRDATSGSMGSGIQIKTGGNGNILYGNVCYNTGGPCILVYDDWDRGQNIIDSNLVLDNRDNGIQASAGAQIINNIIIGSSSNGISVFANDIQPGYSPRNVQIIGNTVIDSSSYCLQGNSWEASSFTVANNAFFCTSAFSVPDQTGAIWESNAFSSGTVPTGVDTTTGAIQVGDASSELVDPEGNPPNLYPLSDSMLINAGSVTYQQYTSRTEYDFDCIQRDDSAPTIGAYQYSSDGQSADAYPLEKGFKWCVGEGPDGGGGGGGGGVSPGGKAALVIFLLILPLGCGAAIGGWIGWRKHNNQPIIPDKAKELVGKIKSKTSGP